MVVTDCEEMKMHRVNLQRKASQIVKSKGLSKDAEHRLAENALMQYDRNVNVRGMRPIEAYNMIHDNLEIMAHML